MSARVCAEGKGGKRVCIGDERVVLAYCPGLRQGKGGCGLREGRERERGVVGLSHPAGTLRRQVAPGSLQQLQNIQMAMAGGEVHGCVALAISHVDEGWVPADEEGHAAFIAAPARQLQRRAPTCVPEGGIGTLLQ